MLRLAEPADLGRILEIYAPYVTDTTVSFEYTVPTPEAFSQRFESITAQFPWLVWEQEGRILGYAYASAPFERAAYRWCAEPSIYLCPEAAGPGIAQKLYQALEWILQEQGSQVPSSLITSENGRSLPSHEKMGYHFRAELPECGYKFDRWLGVIWMEKRLKIVQSPSRPPIPWKTVVQNAKNFFHILDNLSLP